MHDIAAAARKFIGSHPTLRLVFATRNVLIALANVGRLDDLLRLKKGVHLATTSRSASWLRRQRPRKRGA
jgi:hypothetical protein